MKNNENDLNYLCNYSCIDFEQLINKSVLITGATGLIGFNIITTLLTYNSQNEKKINIVAFVRNMTKAEKIYAEYDYESIKFIVGDITQNIDIGGPVDYIIHCASQTSSKEFVNKPVEIIRTAVLGTINLLNIAREKNVKGFVFTSTMEVYGSPETDEKIEEEHGTNLNTMAVRTSYPESKRLCESICCAYASEYNVPTKVVRLTQTFGPGVLYNDNRVFAEFTRCAIEKKDIILHTKGETKRSYLYTADAVSAILLVLISGKTGEAYNAANEDTYCSIYEMAKIVAKTCANGEINVKIDIDDNAKFGYAPIQKMNLDTNKLKSLGWSTTKNLEEMYRSLYISMQKEV